MLFHFPAIHEPFLGFEPRTSALQKHCSTTELKWPQSKNKKREKHLIKSILHVLYLPTLRVLLEVCVSYYLREAQFLSSFSTSLIAIGLSSSPPSSPIFCLALPCTLSSNESIAFVSGSFVLM